MTVLKTYARWLTTDLEAILPGVRALVGRDEDYRFRLTDTIEIVGIGNFCLVAGDADALDEFTGTLGPVVVDDLDATVDEATRHGLRVSRPEQPAKTGRYLYLQYPDGTEVEHLQMNDDTADNLRTERS